MISLRAIRHSQNFLQLHQAILKAYEFDNKHQATFFRSNDRWQRVRVEFEVPKDFADGSPHVSDVEVWYDLLGYRAAPDRKVPFMAGQPCELKHRFVAPASPPLWRKCMVVLLELVHDLGFLDERMQVIHAIWVDEDDMDLLAASGCTWYAFTSWKVAV